MTSKWDFKPIPDELTDWQADLLVQHEELTELEENEYSLRRQRSHENQRVVEHYAAGLLYSWDLTLIKTRFLDREIESLKAQKEMLMPLIVEGIMAWHKLEERPDEDEWDELVNAHYRHCRRARRKRVDLLNKTIRDRRAAAARLSASAPARAAMAASRKREGLTDETR